MNFKVIIYYIIALIKNTNVLMYMLMYNLINDNNTQICNHDFIFIYKNLVLRV